MIKREDIVEGAFVWWKAERSNKSWNVPCKITQGLFKYNPEQTWEHFGLMSLDDMQEITLALEGEAARDEIRPATIGEVKQFLTNQKYVLKQKVIDAQAAVAKAELAWLAAGDAVKNYECSIAELLGQAN